MMKNVKKASPEFATSETFVWWDMDSCPLPSGYDPCRLGPRIDTELKNLGYNGPLTIIGIGNLEGVPHDFLKALSSGGVVIKQLQLGSNMILCVNEALNSSESRFQPPLTMMVISAVHADLLEEVVSVFYIRGSLYNLLLAYPYVTEHADPEPSSLLVDNFGGEWVWDRFGLLKDSGSANEIRRQDTGCEMHFCGLCDLSFPSFDDFTTHFKTPPHADKPYLAKVKAKRLEFIEFDNYFKDDDEDDDIPKTEKAIGDCRRSLVFPSKECYYNVLLERRLLS
uniref:C2H2-type domain-containing protein n=1 Tax=Brassica campestris TaxID=3711 RepID=M4F5S9_BRACM